MRTYIFTARERKIVRQFLSGKTPITDRGLSQIRTRLKTSSLIDDVDLLMRLMEALAKPETAAPA